MRPRILVADDELFIRELLHEFLTRSGYDVATAAEPHEAETPLAVFQRLRGRIQERFPGKQGESLQVLMDELEEKLLKRFPQTDDREVSAEDNSALNQEIETLLNDIEDLAEALEL